MLTEELVSIWKFKAHDQALTRANQGVQTIKSSLTTLAIVTGAASAAMAGLLKMAGTREQMEISFEVLIGDAEKAKKTMQEAIDFANRTPFATVTILNQTKQLLGFGATTEEVMTRIAHLGDIASGLGGEETFKRLTYALGKLHTKTSATKEELNMFAEAGANVYEALEKVLGVSGDMLDKMIRQGKVRLDDVKKALEAMATGEGKFAGMMARQSKTFFGLWSTVKGQMDDLLKETGKKLLPVWKEYMAQYLEWLAANRAVIKLKLERFFQNLSNVVRTGIGIFRNLWIVMDGLAAAFGGWKNILILIATVWVGKVLIGIGQLATGISGLIATFRTLSWAGLASNAKLLLIGLAIAAIVLAVEDLSMAFRGGESFILKFFQSMTIGLGEMVKKTAQWVANLKWVKKLLDILRGWGAKSRALGDVSGQGVAPSSVAEDYVPSWQRAQKGHENIVAGFTKTPVHQMRPTTLNERLEINLNVTGMSPEQGEELVLNKMGEAIRKKTDEDLRFAAKEGQGVYAN